MEIKCSYSKLVPTTQLVPNPKNTNKHPDKQVQLLSKILQYQGWRHPIVVSNLSGYIVAGHGRLDAAKLAGFDEVPIDYQDFENAAQEMAFLESDNLVADLAQHDEVMMLDNIRELELDDDFDLELFGVLDLDIPEIKILDEASEDEVPENVDTRCKLGDVWVLGEHRLMCGDSTSIDAVEKLMDGDKADMVFTDPPYGMNFQSNFKKDKFRPIENDDKILDIAPVVWSFLNDNSAAYICTRWDVYHKWYEQFSEFNIKNCVVWIKGGGGLGDLKHSYLPNHEFIIVAHKGNAKLDGKRDKDSWEIAKDDVNSYQHPTQKPVAVPQFAIEHHAKKTVLDLFGGSGSTLIACEKTNRKCFMMELDPHYCDVILARWEKYTSKTATLCDTI